MKFHCSSSLCFNNFLSKDINGMPMKFYRLPRDESIQSEYRKIFKTDGMNWENGRICAAHWSCGERNGSKHLPDVPVPEDQLEKLKEKCFKAKKRFDTLADKDGKIKESYKNAKRKYEVALQMPPLIVNRKYPATSSTLSVNPSSLASSDNMSLSVNPSSLASSSDNMSSSSTITMSNPSSSTNKVRCLSKGQLKRKLAISDNQVSSLKCELEKANENMDLQKIEIKRLKEELNQQKKNNIDLEMKNLHLSGAALNLRGKDFKYENLKFQKLTFKNLTGLTVEQFDLLADCITPYVHLIPYPDCSNNSEKSVDTTTQFLAVLTICRHGLDFQLMAYILEKSVSTVSRIFSGWVVFLATLFNRLNINPGSNYILKKMPKIFFETGHELTDLVIDATEFKFQNESNFELNSFMFSNYKNNATGKALIGISPNGMGIFFSDIYPGSISDSEITEKSWSVTICPGRS